MDLISSDEGEMRYISDLYTCSYTPTLYSLIQSGIVISALDLRIHLPYFLRRSLDRLF